MEIHLDRNLQAKVSRMAVEQGRASKSLVVVEREDRSNESASAGIPFVNLQSAI
jgi:hypothetical protein